MAGVNANLESMLQKKEREVIKLKQAVGENRAELNTLSSGIKESTSKGKKFELDYKQSCEKLELLELVISEKDKVAKELLEALNDVMASSNDRDDEFAMLSAENDELAVKIDEANAKVSAVRLQVE